jgi:hypothetical protein
MRWHLPTGLGVVVLENATYSGAMATAISLLEAALEGINFQLPEADIWPITQSFAEKADDLVRKWSDDLAGEICSANVALDLPFSERARSIAKLIGEVVGLKDFAGIHPERSDSPLHLVWKVPGHQGDLTCSIRLTPDTPTRIQTLSVELS